MFIYLLTLISDCRLCSEGAIFLWGFAAQCPVRYWGWAKAICTVEQNR